MRASLLLLSLTACLAPCEHAEETFGVIGSLRPASFADEHHGSFACGVENDVDGAWVNSGPFRGDTLGVQLVHGMGAGSEAWGTGLYGGAYASLSLDVEALARGEADWTADAILTSGPETEVPLVDGEVRVIGRPEVLGDPVGGEWDVGEVRLAWDLTFDLGDGAVHLHYWGDDLVSQ